MIDRLRLWFGGRSAREQRLVIVTSAIALAGLALIVGDAIRTDLVTLRARVAAHQRELDEVRRLAAALRTVTPDADGPSFAVRFERAIHEVDSAAAVTPEGNDRVQATLATEGLSAAIAVLRTLEDARPRVALDRIELQRRGHGLALNITASTGGGRP